MSDANESLPLTDAESPEAGDVPYTTPHKRPLKILFFIVMTDMLGFALLLPLAPAIQARFGVQAIAVTIMMSIYAMCQFIATPILGSISDRVGRRPVLIYSQAGSSIASIITAVALAITFKNPTVGLIILYASRVLDGFTGGNLAAAQAYVSDVSTPSTRAKNMGVLGAAFGIGFVMGPAIGGLLSGLHLWLAPIAAACCSATAAILSYAWLPESRQPGRRSEHGHLKTALTLLRQPALAQINAIWFVTMFAFVTAESVFPLFLAHRFGMSQRQVGLMFVIAGVTIVVVQGRMIGPLTRRFGEWRLAIFGPLIFAAGMFLYAKLIFTPLLLVLLAAIVINALGRSFQTPSLSSLVAHQAHPDQQGAAAGLFQGVGSLARVFGPVVSGIVYDRHNSVPFILAGTLTVIASLLTTVLRAQSAGPTPTVT